MTNGIPVILTRDFLFFCQDFFELTCQWNADDADATDFRGFALMIIRENPLHPRHPRSILVAATPRRVLRGFLFISGFSLEFEKIP